MLNDLSLNTQVYLVTGYTDLRRGIDGLAVIVQAQLQLDPFSKALFLFCGRRCDRIKGLLWERDGFLLLYKRLDNGRFQWPRSETQALMLTPQQIRWLLEGLKIEQPKAIREGKPGALWRKCTNCLSQDRSSTPMKLPFRYFMKRAGSRRRYPVCGSTATER